MGADSGVELVAVAAVAENGVIGANGEVPWTLPADREEYRARVADATVILGRRTFEAMLDDLPGREQVVVSRRDRAYDVGTAHPVTGVTEAVHVAASLTDEVAYVLGGAEIYALFLPHLDRLLISRVPGEYEGEHRFPEIDPEAWRLEAIEPRQGYTLETWVRAR